MDILIRFRYHKIALVSDVEETFHEVSVAPEDRDVLRFVWVEDIASSQPKLALYRLTRVVFGVNCSPFLLNASISHHIGSYLDDPAFIERFLSSLYVDDFSGSADTTPEAYQLFLNARQRMAEGRFNLRKWQSNDHQLMQMIESEVEQTSVKDQPKPEEDKFSNLVEDESTYARLTCGSAETLQSSKQQKLLGMNWNFADDKFIVELSHYAAFASSIPLTKREILRIMTAKIYDPLGLIAPIVLPMKQMFQKLCNERLDWDAPLNSELKKEVQKWITDLEAVKHIRLPRCYLEEVCGEVRSVELHGFGDASKIAFGAVVFIRIETDGGCCTSLICSKSRVEPLTNQSVPRLGLVAGLTLLRLVCSV